MWLLTILAIAAVIGIHLWWRRKFAALSGQRAAEIEASHRRQQQTNVDAKAQQQILFNSMIEGLLLLDRTQKIYLANRAFKNLFGLKIELRGKTISLIFDLPLTYNNRVSYWIANFQTKGKTWFTAWLEKSNRYLPMIQSELRSVGLPQDLVYMVMVESGFEANAKSSAQAVGPWQFINSTGKRYGLNVNWWLDERRDMKKSTLAAVKYLRDLYKEFGSWYLVAASYNMGEKGLRRQIEKYKTRDFWTLSQKGALPAETMDYVPKILAAMMIAKSPGVYGFDHLTKMDPIDYELIQAPGGLDLNTLADHLGVTHQYLRELNAELISGYIPEQVDRFSIRIPRGSVSIAADFLAQSVAHKPIVR